MAEHFEPTQQQIAELTHDLEIGNKIAAEKMVREIGSCGWGGLPDTFKLPDGNILNKTMVADSDKETIMIRSIFPRQAYANVQVTDNACEKK